MEDLFGIEENRKLGDNDACVAAVPGRSPSVTSLLCTAGRPTLPTNIRSVISYTDWHKIYTPAGRHAPQRQSTGKTAGDSSPGKFRFRAGTSTLDAVMEDVGAFHRGTHPPIVLLITFDVRNAVNSIK